MMPLKSFYVLQSRLKCSTWNSICWKDICKYNDRSPTYIKQLIHLISFENIFTGTNQGIHEIKFLFKLKDICRLFFLVSSLSREIFILLCFVSLNITGTLQSEGGVLCSFLHIYPNHDDSWRNVKNMAVKFWGPWKQTNPVSKVHQSSFLNLAVNDEDV